jgi:diadenylate cyclase
MEDLLDPEAVAEALHLAGGAKAADAALQPRGFRMLSKVPRLPDTLINNIVDHYGSLDKLSRASTDDLASVDGVGEMWAKIIKESLSHIAESSILDRYN